MSDAPFLLVIAGPNGSGKTTLTNYLLEAGIDFGEYINPDEIAATLNLTNRRGQGRPKPSPIFSETAASQAG